MSYFNEERCIEFISEEECNKFYYTDKYSNIAKEVIIRTLDGYSGITNEFINCCFAEYGNCLEKPVKNMIDSYGAFYSKDLDEVIKYMLINDMVKNVFRYGNNVLVIHNCVDYLPHTL